MNFINLFSLLPSEIINQTFGLMAFFIIVKKNSCLVKLVIVDSKNMMMKPLISTTSSPSWFSLLCLRLLRTMHVC